MSTRLLIGLLSFFVCTLRAQEGFTHYTPDQGVPSSEVYDVICDRKGFVWISTDRGVSRFNGYTFENFYTSDGLTDNVIIELFEDKQDRIWFSANSGRLCYYDYTDAKIHEYRYNDLLKKHLPIMTVIKSIRLDSSGALYVGYLHFGAVSVSKDGELSVVTERRKKFGKIYEAYFREVQGQTFVYSVGGAHHFNDTVKVHIDLPGIRLDTSLRLSYQSFADVYMLKRKNGTIVFYAPGHLIEVVPGKAPLIMPLSDDVRRVFEDRQGRLWICLRHEGLRLYEPGEGIASLQYTNQLSGKYTNAICEDKEQGIWVGVYDDALYYRPMMNVKVEKLKGMPENTVVKSLGAKGEDLYLATASNRLYCLHANGSLDSLILPINQMSWVHEAGDGLMVYGSNRCYVEKNRFRILDQPHIGALSYYIYRTDSIVYAGTYGGLAMYKATKPYTRLRFVRIVPTRFEAIHIYKGHVLLGSNVGVFLLKGNTAVPYNHWFDKACRTTSIGEIHGYLAFSTLGEGIRLVQGEHGRRFTIGTRQGLLSNNINALCVDGESLWAAGSFGLNEIRFHGDSFRIYSYTLSNGLKVSEVRKLMVHNKRLWMVSPKGVYSFAFSNVVNNPETIPVHMLSVTNADTVYTGAALSGNTKVQFNSILRIRYVGLSYKQFRKISYRYRLPEKDSAWIYTMNTEVEFAFLSEGHYTFELSASNEDGEWSAPVSFRFFIDPPFWRTWWFIFGIGVLVIATLFLVFMIRIRRLKQENRIREELYDYRQQALVARMNPHFIFNSLNSIHYFIFNEDKRMAGKYLSRFASLMRLTLELSTREYVKLEDDIRALKLYIEMEALRFRDKFSFTLQIDEVSDVNTVRVPPMLVQPFVENAIKHGLLNRPEGGGKIHVRYLFTGQNLECVVEDNGIGREEAIRLKQAAHDAHRPAGIAITVQRLETACAKNKQAFIFEYVDKTRATHEETGTLVRFHIPFMHDKNADH